MAPFNPPINPTNSPQYGGNSRAIDTPDPIRVQGVETNRIMPEGNKIADESGKYAGQAEAFRIQADATANKGWGDLFSNIVQGGDFLGKAGVQMVKKDIENRVYEVADKERQIYTSELEQMLSGKVGVKNLMDANASMDTEGLPENLQDLPDDLATLQAARTAGKITKLDYQGRLLEKAKALRAEYNSPELRKYIDDQFAKVTGQNPANARINTLITAINAQASQANSAQNKLLTFIKQNKEVPNAEIIYQKVLSGEMGEAEAFTRISRYSQAKEKISARALVASDQKLTREESARTGGEAFDYAASVTVSGVADVMLERLGLTDPTKVAELDAMNKAGGVPQAKWNSLNAEFANTVTSIRTQMFNEARKSGLIQKLGGIDKVNERINEAIKPLTNIHERIISKDFGGIYSAGKEAQEMIDDAKLSLLKDSKAGPAHLVLPVLKDLGGEQYLQKFNLEQALGKNGVPERFKSWFGRWSASLEAQPKSSNGQVQTFNDMIDEMKGKSEFSNKADQAKITSQIVKKVSKIADPSVPDPIKEGIAAAAFSEGNNRFLSKLEEGGMPKVYQDWTAPDVSKEMKRLGEKKPGVWRSYTEWAQTTFSDEIVPREIANLNKYSKNPDVKIEWDTVNKRFNVERTGMEAQRVAARVAAGGEGANTSERVAKIKEFDMIRASINRINSAMYNLVGMAKLEGGTDNTQADAFLLRSITKAAGPDALQNIQGIPNHLANMIVMGSAYGNRK